MNQERTYRCGWRYDRPAADELRPFDFPMVVIRRGEFRARIRPEMFDAMSDEEFADFIGRMYREHAFEHLQRDLDTLARQLIGELDQGNGMIVTGVPYDDIKAALYRWQKAKRDTEGTVA